jgi:hypothetical protein
MQDRRHEAQRQVTETLIVLEARGQFVAGLVLHNDLVIEGADILNYMRKQRWSKAQVWCYAKSKGWKCLVAHEMLLTEGAT